MYCNTGTSVKKQLKIHYGPIRLLVPRVPITSFPFNDHPERNPEMSTGIQRDNAIRAKKNAERTVIGLVTYIVGNPYKVFTKLE